MANNLDNLKTFTRDQIIRAVIKLHNFTLKKHFEAYSQSKAPDFWNIEEYEVKPDRFYLSESLSVVDLDDYDNKAFYPKIEVRYHFRSKERAAFGNQHDYFFKGYKSTFSFTYQQISDPDFAMEEINKEYNDLIIKIKERNANK